MAEIRDCPKIQIGKYTVYVASTLEQKKQGLQFISQLPTNHLMLFPGMAANSYFHTVNCAFPMDIVSLNSDNKVLDIWAAGPNMKSIGPTPPTTTSVIEGPLGWSKKANLQIGANLMEALLA